MVRGPVPSKKALKTVWVVAWVLMALTVVYLLVRVVELSANSHCVGH